jgi:hypothetical protein
MKQTAVEWLEQRLFDRLGKFTKGDIDQAKAMEKEQIIDAFLTGYLDDLPDPLPKDYYELNAEQYYNETFKSE